MSQQALQETARMERLEAGLAQTKRYLWRLLMHGSRGALSTWRIRVAQHAIAQRGVGVGAMQTRLQQG